MGLIIGPRGATCKRMETETGAKIMIRGRGSVKEGKLGRRDGVPNPGDDEPMHVLITAPSIENLKKAVDKIKELIRIACECPETENELKKLQLRELAILNGTLREEEMVRCKNCGNMGHRHWQCTEEKKFVNVQTCTICGGHGHLPVDCKFRRDPQGQALLAAPVDKVRR